MEKYFQISVCRRILAAACLGIVPGFSLENTNIIGYNEHYSFFEYNRLRADVNLSHDNYPDISARLLIDNETLYVNEPGSLRNKSSIYRAYLEYSGARHFWVVGKQRIPLGVGRFWNPIDVFNPIDIEAIEPGERPGTNSIRYEYALSSLSNIDATVAEGKAALRIKGYLDFADVAFVGEWDEEDNQNIIGWELEGELPATGIELRSEGGSFYDIATHQRHTELIIGAEHGFAGSLVLTGEYHYSDDGGSRDELGISATFQPAMLWSCFLTGVIDLEDGSGFLSPVVEYSLGDEMTLSGGAFVYYGDKDSVYGDGDDRLYLRWFVHF